MNVPTMFSYYLHLPPTGNPSPWPKCHHNSRNNGYYPMHHVSITKHNLKLHHTKYGVNPSIIRSWVPIQTENLVLYTLIIAVLFLSQNLALKNNFDKKNTLFLSHFEFFLMHSGFWSFLSQKYIF